MPATQYGSLHIPDGYIPPSVNPPVIPQDVISPMTDPNDWRRPVQSPHHQRTPSQNHYRIPSSSHPPVIPINPSVMPQPQPFAHQPYSQPTSSAEISSFSSPPFKPFKPLPVIARTKPPTPPPKMVALPTYKAKSPYLVKPMETVKTEAQEIMYNKAKRDIQSAQEEWERQDEEREKVIREKREERERLINGTSAIRVPVPTMQTVTALVVDPTTVRQLPPPPKKEKRSLWAKLFRSGKSNHKKRQLVAEEPVQTIQANVIPIRPQHVVPSIPGVMMHVQETPTSSRSSSSGTHSSPATGHSGHSPGRSNSGHGPGRSNSGHSPGRSHSGRSPGRSPGHLFQSMPTPAVIPTTPGSRYGGAMPNAVGQPMGTPSPFIYQGQRSTTPEISPPPNAAFFSFPSPIRM